ncbi:MAG: PQQ-dependent dehydrogenase, methanol/ethanol family [Deltaproteobacteria bacterium]|nr:PQQ-dependent dehydrogenase, methanol/ethanol family [Deltaproteobacteria bacterium]
MNQVIRLVPFALMALISLFSNPVAAQNTVPYTPVTAERLLHPEPDNWLMYRGTYNSWGYSPLDQITTKNVDKLTPMWTFSTGVNEGHQSPPLVNNGVMFITTPKNQVLALNASTGELLWRYQRELPEDLFQLHPTNRGVALYGDKVFLATVDAHLLALNAKTGEVVWDQTVENYLTGYYMTLAPLVVRGKVMVGVSGGELGIRGFVQAFEAETGKSVWKTYTVPGPGEKGHETWSGDTWKTGAVSIWVTGSYDPQLNLTYWGTGNPGPFIAAMRPGDNLYANSVIALDADTGELKAHHQYHWNDAWDWDEVSAPLLLDVQRPGKSFKALVHAGRNGYLWLLERKADKIDFVNATPFVRQNVFTKIDPESGRPTYDPQRIAGIGKRAEFCPSVWGGKDWPPAAYNPQTGYLYIPANQNLCSALTGQETTYQPGQLYIGVDFSKIELLPTAEAKDHIGEIQAWDINAGKKAWTVKFKSHNWGPLLTTGGGLIFSGGTNDRYFRAFDAKTGKLLWQQRTNSGVTGVPTSYRIDGIQYVAVQSGWGVDAQRKQELLDKAFGTKTFVPQGGVLWVFALRK